MAERDDGSEGKLIEQRDPSDQIDRSDETTPADRPQTANPASAPIDPASLPVGQRVALLVKALNGARRTNEALARCGDGDAMVEVLLDASRRLGLNLSRRDLLNTPPIRDWIWWKNKEALLTIGDNRPRYQQDGGQGRPPADAAEPPREPRRRFLGLF